MQESQGSPLRKEWKNPLFDAGYIRKIIKNPVYCGKIAYGRRRTEKVLCSIGK